MSLKNEINQLEEELARVLQSLQELKIKVDSLEAVSYTHLDVYKRQGHTRP